MAVKNARPEVADEDKPLVIDTRNQPAKRRNARTAAVTAGAAYEGSKAASRAVTQRSSSSYSGKGMLTTLLIVGFAIIGVRVVADYEVNSGGEAQGKVLHPAGQYGPLPIMAGMIVTYFLLSFLAAAGGTKAKLAVILAGIIDLTLAVNSYSEVKKVSSTIGSIGKITVPSPSGTEGSGASSTNTTAPDSTGSSGTGKAKVTTPTTNAIGAGNRQAAALVKNFLPDLAGSFDIIHPNVVIGATANQWNNLTNAISDYATSGTDATWLALEKSASAVGLAPASNFLQSLGNNIYGFFKGLF